MIVALGTLAPALAHQGTAALVPDMTLLRPLEPFSVLQAEGISDCTVQSFLAEWLLKGSFRSPRRIHADQPPGNSARFKHGRTIPLGDLPTVR
jgi:hypothetical protein